MSWIDKLLNRPAPFNKRPRFNPLRLPWSRWRHRVYARYEEWRRLRKNKGKPSVTLEIQNIKHKR